MRVIARLDIKNDWVIKGIHLEGLRKVGNPIELTGKYYDAGVHEIIFMDAVASLYDRNNLFHIIESACENVFIPICVGGGLRSIDDVSRALDSGADKVAINTGAVHDISLVTKVANQFGSQCFVGSIEAKRKPSGSWEAYIDNGREPTGLDALEWAKQLEEAGIGELLVTSIDQEGTRRGFDLELVEAITAITTRPVIFSGGYGEPKHLGQLLERTTPSAIALASVFHYGQTTPAEMIQITSPSCQREFAA